MSKRTLAIALLCALKHTGAQSLPKFMGREVTITVPEQDADGFYPKGPASVCIEAPPDEAHYSPHRYIISAYVSRASSLVDGLYYYLEDRYMTARKYDSDERTDILGPEKPEILARLKRVKAERKHQTP